MDLDGLGWQTGLAESAGDPRRQDRAHRAVDVADRQLDRHRLAALERGPGELEELIVERLVEAVVLRLDAVNRHLGGHVGLVQHRRQVDALGLPVLDRFARLEHVDAADHLVDGLEA